MTSFVECTCRLAIDLLRTQTQENSERNIISSPLSMEMGLGMLLLGSNETTADQIKQVLHFSHWPEPETSTDIPLLGSHCDKPGGIHKHFQQLLSTINHHSKSYELNIVNRLYGSNTYDFKENYIHCLKQLYNSGLESVDFMNAAEKVREKINSWVESQTKGAIKNFVPANSLDPSSLLVLVNVVNFKGMWRTQFNPKDTHRAVFWTGKGQSIYVEMMTREDNFNLANITNPSMTVLEVPYENEELSFFFFVPGPNGNIEEITKKLSYKTLQEWTSPENMRNVRAKVYLPKFSVEDTYSMKPILMGMGINELFISGKANLSGISGKPNLHVADCKFKGCIKISEDGGHAAGTSRAEIVGGSYTEVKFNIPFMGVLRNNATGIILFIIKICVPE